MSDIIQLLPDHVANQIAAGEVVQRPSSVVKELVENAIDAGATSITLLLKDSGKNLIQVIDNGKGMSATDAKKCFERHATSKIKDAKDLFNLHTKGFRGEALASIAAVAQVELKTKREIDQVGTLVKIEGNKITNQEMVQMTTGSSIAVKNLFFNIPARRNFLKSDTVETRHIIDEFHRVALVHPEIGFILHHNNKEIYNLKPDNLRKRIVSIFGTKTNEKLVPIDERTDIITIEGYVAKPEFAKKKRGEQFFFVNNRFIKSSYLNHAVISAFDGLLEQGSHPSYFLYLTVPPQTIDINIHPTKTEIKFDNEKALYAILRATVKHSLGQYNVAPVLDFNRDANLDTPYSFKDKNEVSSPKILVNTSFNPFDSEPKKTHQTEKNTFESSKNYRQDVKNNLGSWESLYTTEEITTDEVKQEELFKNDSETETGKTFQIQKKYIISTIKSGIVLIHQSSAHQKILFEQYKEKITQKKGTSQQLLFPITINFSKSDIEMIYSIKADLENTGFVFNEFTMENIIIGGVPSGVNESEVNKILEQLLEDLRLEVPDLSFGYINSMAKSLAKSLAIKTGTNLSSKEQESLVNDLFSCSEPSISPNGKATFKTLTLAEIDSIFNS